ncbi:DNA ligase D [Luteimonas sp. BDR2-5]|uniref:DNA ligase D n=1 Tax=Proluteimonas luteida TaxID=2878685 RepID=UPI001E4132E4|nr:DNA ligase D [Luteimonas sp. BDR2-5]MCD9029550.1 DNA ligase D [Luteimonas sp. BDR2-5]
MALHEYRRKRDFGRTREPPGRPAPAGARPRFVVQLHHASHRHYDFRLQVGDTLKSWAVPKGPSYDPKVKRMAIQVEDHPLDYAGFEGEIPRGQYGGGHVALFDQGVWTTDGDPEAQLAKGHLRFELFGDRLKGGWHLVRSGKPARQPQWLLFKADDAYAGTLEADDLLAGVTAPPAEDARRAGRGKPNPRRRATVPLPVRGRRRDWAKAALRLPGARRAPPPADAFAPQLATAAATPPSGLDWVHELKWDGYRLLATIAGSQVRLWSRNGLAWTERLPEVVEALSRLGLESAAFDGELIAGEGTRDDFNLLQATLSGERQAAVAYVLFDLLHVDGVDIGAAPLRERKALLQALLGEPPPHHLAFSAHVDGDGAQAYALAVARGFEGIVSKRADRAYVPGRGDDWRKIRARASDEYAVVGFTPPKGARSGFGALLLARPDGAGGWTYAGRVGSGFSDAMLRDIAAQIGRAGRAQPTVHVPAHDTDLRGARWFAPRFVVEVFARGNGRSSLLRQPTLKALRPDKTVEELMAPATGKTRRRSAAGTAAKPAPGKRAKAAGRTAGKAPDDAPALTSPDKLLYPDDGIRKRDVADYYTAVMPWLLPEIVDRPLSVVRCPSGIAGGCFFQKHHAAGMPRVDAVPIEEEDGGIADYLVVRDAAAVLALVQLNTLEFHPWGAHAEHPDLADRIVFDLDPGPGVAWADIVAAARHVRALLSGIGLQSWVRTTGGKGLHVVVPLAPAVDWAQVKPFAHAFASSMAEQDPLRFVASASKRLRKDRIFVDYLRNSRGATSIASFSLRARPGAPVAMPLRWEELGRVKAGNAFDIHNALRRLTRLKAHPWDGIDAVRQDLSHFG